MTRCSICDCSQSAASVYNDSLVSPNTSDVRYSKKFDEFLCLDCRQSILEQRNFWREVDGDTTDFNAYEAELSVLPEGRPTLIETD
jgi:hypothetical protein